MPEITSGSAFHHLTRKRVGCAVFMGGGIQPYRVKATCHFDDFSVLFVYHISPYVPPWGWILSWVVDDDPYFVTFGQITACHMVLGEDAWGRVICTNAPWVKGGHVLYLYLP